MGRNWKWFRTWFASFPLKIDCRGRLRFKKAHEGIAKERAFFSCGLSKNRTFEDGLREHFKNVWGRRRGSLPSTLGSSASFIPTCFPLIKILPDGRVSFIRETYNAILFFLFFLQKRISVYISWGNYTKRYTIVRINNRKMYINTRVNDAAIKALNYIDFNKSPLNFYEFFFFYNRSVSDNYSFALHVIYGMHIVFTIT